MRYELSDYEWSVIGPMLPNKPRGVPRVRRPAHSQRHLLSLAIKCAVARFAGEIRSSYHLLQSLRSSAPGGVWDRIMDALATAHNARC